MRNDSGIFEGGEISVFYDPLISKLVVWGKDRHEAITRMKRALQEYHITGVRSNIPFCLLVMRHPRFIEGDFDTHFIADEFNLEDVAQGPDELEQIAAIAAVMAYHRSPRNATVASHNPGTGISPWLASGRRNGIR